MSVTPEQLHPMSSICESAELFSESAQEYVFLRKLRIRVGTENYVVDALLSPTSHTGYTTRLFLSQAFPNKGANWSVHQILGRAWHTWSWQGVPTDIPLIQMLLSHLDALK